MKSWLFGIALVALSASASAANLKSCDGVSTAQGYKYIGTYCVDFACTYVFTRMFNSYCPYSVDQ